MIRISPLKLVSTLALLALVFPAVGAQATARFDAAVVENLNPANGVVGGKVQILGSGLSTVNEVRFGAAKATGLIVVSDSELEVFAPFGLGLVDVTVISESGSTALRGAFYYEASSLDPQVLNVTPQTVALSGNRPVTIQGSGFSTATRVLFGAQEATQFRVESANKIVAVVPEGQTPGQVEVRVENARGISNSNPKLTFSGSCELERLASIAFKFRSSSLSKAQIARIREVANQAFLSECGEITLRSYKAKLKIGMPSSYSSLVRLSADRTKAVQRVLQKRLAKLGSPTLVETKKYVGQRSESTRSNWDSKTSYRRVLIEASPADAPYAFNLYPSSGAVAGGTEVILSGQNMELVTAVNFGSEEASSFSIVSPTSIRVISPAHSAGVVDLSLEFGAGKASMAKAYRFTGEPKISTLSISNSGVAGSSKVSITGENFFGLRSGSSVMFGAIPAKSFVVVSPTLIEAVVPPQAVGTKSLKILAAGGVATTNFSYNPPPYIDSISPNSGVVGGGTSVVIRGTNLDKLLGQNPILFGQVAAASFQVISATELVAITPSSFSGAKSVSVLGLGGTAKIDPGYTFGGSISPVSQVVRATKSVEISPTRPFSTNSGFSGTVSYAISGGTLPSGLIFSSSNGVVSGTPTAVLTPTSFTVTATGSLAGIGVSIITVSVSELTPTSQSLIGTENTPVSSTRLTPGDGFEGNISFSVVSGSIPEGLSLNSQTGVISGTPLAASAPRIIKIRAMGSISGYAEAIVSISVAAQPTPPAS